jgi:hypothetical protein
VAYYSLKIASITRRGHAPCNDWEQTAERLDGLTQFQVDVHLLFPHIHALPTPKLIQQAEDPPPCSGE